MISFLLSSVFFSLSFFFFFVFFFRGGGGERSRAVSKNGRKGVTGGERERGLVGGGVGG